MCFAAITAEASSFFCSQSFTIENTKAEDAVPSVTDDGSEQEDSDQINVIIILSEPVPAM